MISWWMLPFALQGVAMAVDEFHFHRTRGLPLWERLGHPLDTLTLIACVLFALLSNYSGKTLLAFAAMGSFSCLFVTKDEWVHAKHCAPAEQWLHAVLFILHPLVLASTAYLWSRGMSGFLRWQLSILFSFLIYQFFYWNCHGKQHPSDLIGE